MDIPASICGQFNGDDLDDKRDVAAILSTVDDDGWPHLSFLSVGEVLCGRDRIAVTLWARSHAVANLMRTRRGVLFVAADGFVHELRLEDATVIGGEDGLTRIIALLVDAHRENRAPYAQVHSLIDFTLDDPTGTLERWRTQIAAMHNLLATTPHDDEG